VCDHYTIQAELFAEAILQDIVVPTPLDDAILNMRVLDAIVRSATSETWEQVS
jgi:predicted dehydrogenase